MPVCEQVCRDAYPHLISTDSFLPLSSPTRPTGDLEVVCFRHEKNQLFLLNQKNGKQIPDNPSL